MVVIVVNADKYNKLGGQNWLSKQGRNVSFRFPPSALPIDVVYSHFFPALIESIVANHKAYVMMTVKEEEEEETDVMDRIHVVGPRKLPLNPLLYDGAMLVVIVQIVLPYLPGRQAAES